MQRNKVEMTVISAMFRQLWQGVPVANVLWFDVPVPDESGIQALLDDVTSEWSGTLATAQSNEWSLTDVLVRVFDGGAPFSTPYDTPSLPLVGTADAQDMPRNNALLLSTAHNGPRPNRGRAYWAGMTEASWDGDSFDNTAIAASEDFANGLLSLSTGTWVIARPNYAANTAIGHAVTSYFTHGETGSQRGRRTG